MSMPPHVIKTIYTSMVSTGPCPFVSAPLPSPFHWLWVWPFGYYEEWDHRPTWSTWTVIAFSCQEMSFPFECEPHTMRQLRGEKITKQGIWLNPTRGLQEGLPKWNPLPRHESSWAFYMFRVIKEIINTWQWLMGAIKPLLLSPLFKKKSCQL